MGCIDLQSAEQPDSGLPLGVIYRIVGATGGLHATREEELDTIDHRLIAVVARCVELEQARVIGVIIQVGIGIGERTSPAAPEYRPQGEKKGSHEDKKYPEFTEK